MLRRDGDAFIAIASVWLSKPIDDVTPSDRAITKQIVYGIMYGASGHEIASISGIVAALCAN